MSADKLVDSTALDTSLTAIADAIRAKTGGSSQLVFPMQFVSEIGNIPSGGGLDFDVKTVNVTDNTPTVTRAFNNFIFIAQVAEDELPSTYANNTSYFMMFVYVNGAFINKTGDKGYDVRTNSSSYPFNGNSTNMNSTSVGSTSITFSTYSSHNMFHANWKVLQIELPLSTDYPLYSFSTH